MTSAVAMLVAGVLRSSTIGPISTGSALTLKDIWICARTMTIKASHGALSESCALGVSTGSVSVVNELPFRAVPGLIERRGKSPESALCDLASASPDNQPAWPAQEVLSKGVDRGAGLAPP